MVHHCCFLKVFLLYLVVATHGLPIEPEAEPVAEAGHDHIIKYDDEEIGHGHVQTGVAGEMVEGALYYKVRRRLFWVHIC